MVEFMGGNNIKPIVSAHILSDKDFEALMKEYEKELRGLAYKYVRDWIIVEDIMQEVFIKVFLKLDSFEQRSSIRSWLYTITYNQCIDHFRSKCDKYTLLTENPEKIKVTQTEPAEIEALQRFEHNCLYQTVHSLPIQFKEPIILFYFKQYSYNEICELLNEKIGVIKSRLFRGRRLLKEKYIDYQKNSDRK